MIRLLVFSNFVAPARLLLIRLIDCKMPVSFDNPENRHIEIANAMVDLSLVPELAPNVGIFDLIDSCLLYPVQKFGF